MIEERAPVVNEKETTPINIRKTTYDRSRVFAGEMSP